jgi:16S rRNA pseudouridine516 synthase
MFAAAANRVTALHRESIGALTLPADLDAGAWRVATADDLARLFA